MKSPVLSILFLLISVTLLAVPNDFRFRHFSVEDGLSSNSVRAIMQDKYGFLRRNVGNGNHWVQQVKLLI